MPRHQENRHDSGRRLSYGGRMQLTDYAGPTSRLTIDAALELGCNWAYALKKDGCYAQVSTDQRGAISSIIGRNGRPVREGDDFIGTPTGLPSSTLAAELDAHTEAGIRERTARGFSCLHLFDAIRIRNRYVAREPVRERLGHLHRWQAAIECAPPGEYVDDTGRCHDKASGDFKVSIRSHLKRMPILPYYYGRTGLEQLWSEVQRETLEGVVATRLDAPLGRRGTRLKIKPTDTLDCTVLSVSAGGCTLSWAGRIFAVGPSNATRTLSVGDVAEVAHDGFYERDSTPRFARIVRKRTDLM